VNSESISNIAAVSIVSKLQSSTVKYSFTNSGFLVLVSLVVVAIFGGEVGGVFEQLEMNTPNKIPAKMFLEFIK
jgi:hypothetical protein